MERYYVAKGTQARRIHKARHLVGCHNGFLLDARGEEWFPSENLMGVQILREAESLTVQEGVPWLCMLVLRVEVR